jgi:hypothetical protein
MGEPFRTYGTEQIRVNKEALTILPQKKETTWKYKGQMGE